MLNIYALSRQGSRCIKQVRVSNTLSVSVDFNMVVVNQIQSFESPDAPDSTSEPAPQQRVLVVDDSRLQRKILSSMVKGWGFEVVEASTGQEGLKIAQEMRPDIILSDWMMPEMNGLEFCQAFRALPGDQYSYFILLTSKSEKDEIACGLDAGADDFLTKPVNADELRARVQAGERILAMQRELTHKNKLISETLVELQRLYDSLDDDLVEAKRLQQSLIPQRSITFDEGQLNLMLQQSGHVGGDLVGFFPAGDHHLGLFSIDVSGHGISSALMTARLAGYLSASAPDHNVALCSGPDGKFRPRRPKVVIEELNDLIMDEMETELYFTMILAIVELATGKVVMSQAGHPHPAIQRQDGNVQVEGPGGLPVGLIPGATYTQFEITLAPGERLFLFSDGVSECPTPNGDLLDDAGVQRIVRDLKEVKGPAFFESLLWYLSEFAEGVAFPDDISGVSFEYRPDCTVEKPRVS